MIKAPILRHIMFAAVLMLFLPILRQQQALSLISFVVYFGYIGLDYAGKGELARKFLFIPMVLWLAIAILAHDYSLLILASIFPSLIPEDEGKTSEKLRWLVWLAIPIAFYMFPMQGVSVPERLHSHAPALIAILLSVISLPMPEHHVFEVAEKDKPKSDDFGDEEDTTEDAEREESKHTYSELMSMELMTATLKLDYHGFDRKSAIQTTLDAVTSSSKVKYAAYYRFNEADKTYSLENVSGRSPLKLQKTYPAGVGMVGQVYTSGNYIYANDLLEKESDETKRALLRGMDALLSLPVDAYEKPAGVIYIGFSEMPEEEQTVCISLCETVAKKLGRELERLNVHSHVEKKSLTDKLTGLYNRQFFDDAIEQEFQKAKENGTNLAYVMLDLDYFKQMNDCHGHDFGDKVLMLASEIFSRNIRKTDFACRTGGDEFSLIITDASKEAVYEIVKRIRSDYANAVEKYKLYAEKDGEPVKSSLSIGVAVYPHPKAVSATALVKLADLAVYHVKKNGKNSFCFVK